MQHFVRESPLNLKGLIPKQLPAPVQPLFESMARGVLGLGPIERLYRTLPPLKNPCEFARAALKRLGARFDVRSEEQFRIPQSGAAVVIANHPFGGLEGLFMVWLLKCLRDDVRILASFQLSLIPELKELFIPVDPFGGRRATRANIAGLRRALHWVKGGGLLLAFPAGEVSHFDLQRSAICDPPWSDTIARLVRLAQAPVVPVHFEGRNSLQFQLAGFVHPRLRTALLPRELLNKSKTHVPVRIGPPIPFSRLASIESDEALAAHLRLKTYMLAAHGVLATKASAAAKAVSTAPGVDVEPAIEPEILKREIAALPQAQRLTAGSGVEVYHGNARQLPFLLQEIGRLREETFRAVGEGTGRALDLDLYDDYYEHLFVWNPEKGELVGAYRMGAVDRICERYGKRGLYTTTLFEYREPLLRLLNPALELGRSFVRAQYQKSFAALLMLWKGIGEYVARHPRHSILFGAVSISNDYANLSQQMLVEYLRRHNYELRLARLVKARRPFRRRHDVRVLGRELDALGDIETFSGLLSDIEPDGKGVPILLRQYLKLGGRLLGFNVDPAFAHSIDCLIMVDLRETDPRVLTKYMGRESAQAFLAMHGVGRVVGKQGEGRTGTGVDPRPGARTAPETPGREADLTSDATADVCVKARL
jgi:putative hemolysin